MKQSFLKSTKTVFGQLHLWLGLASGLIVFIICLTGTILAFEKNIEDWFNRKAAYVEPQGEKLPVDVLVANYKQQHSVPISRLRDYDNPKRATYIYGRDMETDQRVYTYYNPYTGKETGQLNAAASNFFSQTMRLHRWLLVRNPGRLIVGIATTIFLFMLLSGLILWWPRKRAKLKNSLRINRKAPWKIINYQLHNVLGFYSLIFLFVMAFSGLYIGQKWFKNGVNTAITQLSQEKQAKDTPNKQASPKAQKTSVEAAPGFNYQSLVRQANEQLAYDSDVYIYFPTKPEDPIRINKYPVRFGSRLSETVYFDGQTGQLTEVSTFDQRDRVQQYRYINRFLHTGELMGRPLQLLFFIACIVGTSLPITGTIIWINKMKKR